MRLLVAILLAATLATPTPDDTTYPLACATSDSCELGEPCVADADCRSGHCVQAGILLGSGYFGGGWPGNSVCCERACDGDEACWARYLYDDQRFIHCVQPIERCAPELSACYAERDGYGLCESVQPRFGLCLSDPLRPTPTPTPVIRDNPCGCPFFYVDTSPLCIVPPKKVELGCKPSPHDPCARCCEDPWTCTWTCPGDCNRNGRVAIDELTRAVSVLLGQRPLTACAMLDANRDGEVRIAELIRAVGMALGGCD